MVAREPRADAAFLQRPRSGNHHDLALFGIGPTAPPKRPGPSACTTWPGSSTRSTSLGRAVEAAIATSLTPHQGCVMPAVLIDDVPIDVLAERLGSTRHTLNKTLHDVRRRLRTERHRRRPGARDPDGAQNDRPHSRTVRRDDRHAAGGHQPLRLAGRKDKSSTQSSRLVWWYVEIRTWGRCNG